MDSLLNELEQRAQTISSAGTKVIEVNRTYFENNRTRMEYRKVERLGGPLGSGAVESTCFQLQDRFKRTNQFWTRPGTRSLMALELARRNGDWHRLWQKAA